MIAQKVIQGIKDFKPGILVLNLNVILVKFLKVLFIYRVARGFVILIGLITLLSWIGFDFTHVLNFFAAIPELLNLHETWVGDVYTAIFNIVTDVINGIAEGAPEPPDGKKVLNAVKKVVEHSK